MSLLVNQRYEVSRLVGSGGMGHVLWAVDRRRPGAPVALKLVGAEGGGEEAREGLRREFLTLGDLDHPGLARVWDLDVVRQVERLEPSSADDDALLPLLEGRPLFLAREFVGGRSLLEATAGLDTVERLGVMRQLCEVIAWLHDQGLLHRDLKPENVFVSPRRAGGGAGQVRLLDFGLVDERGAAERRSGTAQYLAPEVLEGGPATPQAELYAFGIMMHEVFLGAHPFGDAADTVALVRAHLRGIQGLPDALPAPLRSLTQALLARQPEDRPASAWEVLDALDGALAAFGGEPVAGLSGGSARLVGREEELALLRGQVDARAEGHLDGYVLRAVVLTGPPGIGRTRLMRQLRAWARVSGLRVLGGEAGHEGAAWRGLFRDLLLDRRSARQIPYLPLLRAAVQRADGSWAEGLAPEEARARLREAGLALLEEEGRAAPFVLIFEDLQRADPETLEWFEHLARLLLSREVFLVATTWSPGPAASAVAALRNRLQGVDGIRWLGLEGLSEGEVRQLAGRVLRADPGPEIAARLHAHTDGNPLFLEAILRAAGTVPRIGERLDSGVLPGAVEEASAAQLLPLGPDAVSAVVALAVLGRPASDVEVSRLVDAPEPAVTAALDAAVEVGVLREEVGVYRFTHGILAQICAARPDVEERRILHHRAAVLCDWDPSDPLARLAQARHWRGAGDDTRALAALTAAASLAEASFRTALATELYEAIIEVLDAGGLPPLGIYSAGALRWHARVRLAQLALWSGETDRTERLAEAMLADTLPADVDPSGPDGRATLWSLLGQVWTRHAAWDQALERFEEGLREADGLRASEVLDRIAEVQLRRGAPSAASQAAEAALENLRGVPPSTPPPRLAELRASILSHLGRAAQEQGRFDEALANLEEARTLFEAGGHLRGRAEVLGALGALYELREATPEALGAFEASLALAERIGDLEAGATTLSRLGLVRYMAGDAAGGVECLQACVEKYRQLDNPQGEARALNALGLFHHVRGAYADAIRARQEAMEQQQALGDVIGLAMTRLNLGILYYEIGDMPGALAWAKQALGELDAEQKLRVARCRQLIGIVLSSMGEGAAGLAELTSAERDFAELKVPDFHASTQANLAEHHLRDGDLATALVWIDRAMALVPALAKPSALQVQVARARVLLADPSARVDALEEALDEALKAASHLSYADCLWQVFEIRGRLALKRGRPMEAVRWLRRSMEVLFACHAQLPPGLQEVYVGDPRRQVVRNALEVAVRQAGRGGRLRRARERHEPGVL